MYPTVNLEELKQWISSQEELCNKINLSKNMIDWIINSSKNNIDVVKTSIDLIESSVCNSDIQFYKLGLLLAKYVTEQMTFDGKKLYYVAIGKRLNIINDVLEIYQDDPHNKKPYLRAMINGFCIAISENEKVHDDIVALYHDIENETYNEIVNVKYIFSIVHPKFKNENINRAVMCILNSYYDNSNLRTLFNMKGF